MGGSLSSNARQLAQRVAPGNPRKLKPFSAEEMETLNRMAEKDQLRMRELPSMEELNSKDATLDNFLSKLGGSIAGRDLSPDEPAQASTSGRAPAQMPPARPPQALRAAEAASWRAAQSTDDQPGRLQSYVIREILQARTAAASEQKALDLQPFISMYGADRSKLLSLMEQNCLPTVGKVATFGHQYAFARAPVWWLKDGVSGAQFLSEPEELRKRLMGNPVGSRSGSGSAMFGGRQDSGGGDAAAPPRPSEQGGNGNAGGGSSSSSGSSGAGNGGGGDSEGARGRMEAVTRR